MKYTDSNPSDRAFVVLSVLHALMWLGGIACFTVWPLSGSIRAAATPVFLWNAAALTCLLLARRKERWLIWVGIAGFFVEVFGVATGFPFGAYVYTNQFGAAAFGTPLVLGAAWFILIAYARTVTARLSRNATVRAGAGAAWMGGMDLIIEPVATGPMGAWIWLDAGAYYGVPAANFAAWFAISFVMLRVSDGVLSPPRYDFRLAALGASLLLFFTVIAGAHGFVTAAVCGACMLGLTLASRAPLFFDHVSNWRERTHRDRESFSHGQALRVLDTRMGPVTRKP